MGQQKQRNSNYSFGEKIMNIVFFVRSKLIPSARLIRFPIVIRGKQYINFGKSLTTGRNCRIEVNGVHDDKCLVFGNNVNMGDNVSIRCADNISIGNNVLMGSKVLIIDNAHGNYGGGGIQDSPDIAPNERLLSTASVVIEDNVWIGDGVVIQKGITVGRGSIIAANSVVTKDVPPAVIVGGIPAKILKQYSSEEGSWIKYEGKV